jgi:hypothetical protein
LKLRHAAALALTGWYLIMPPTSQDYPRGNVNAPLSTWVKRPATYRSKDECEHVLDRFRRLTKHSNRKISAKYMETAQCVATDDPRLAK